MQIAAKKLNFHIAKWICLVNWEIMFRRYIFIIKYDWVFDLRSKFYSNYSNDPVSSLSVGSLDQFIKRSKITTFVLSKKLIKNPFQQKESESNCHVYDVFFFLQQVIQVKGVVCYYCTPCVMFCDFSNPRNKFFNLVSWHF